MLMNVSLVRCSRSGFVSSNYQFMFYHPSRPKHTCVTDGDNKTHCVTVSLALEINISSRLVLEKWLWDCPCFVVEMSSTESNLKILSVMTCFIYTPCGITKFPKLKGK